MKNKERGQVTLIEMIIVVAIIGISAAIAIPQFANMVRRLQNKARAERGLPPLPEPYQYKGCFGTVASAFPKDGKIVKVYTTGCVEEQ